MRRTRLVAMILGLGFGLGTGLRRRGRRPLCASAGAGMRVGVVGGGMAGVAVAYHLVAFHGARVTLYDEAAPGAGGATAAAAGILHPLSPRGRLMWLGAEGLAEAKELLAVAQQHLEERESLEVAGSLLRPLMSDKNAETFAAAAEKDPSLLSYLEAGDVASTTEGRGAYVIEGGSVIDVRSYLNGLWNACVARGAKLNPRRIALREDPNPSDDAAISLAELRQREDAVVLTAGAALGRVLSVRGVTLQAVRGECLEFAEATEDATVLKSGLLAGEYVLPGGQEAGTRMVRLGATKTFLEEGDGDDRGFFEVAGDDDGVARVASDTLAPKAARLFPPLLGPEFELKRVRSAVRVHSQRSNLGRVPVAGRIDEDEDAALWCLGALGARGLIHHAILGRYVAEAVASGDETLIPPPCRKPLEALRDHA